MGRMKVGMLWFDGDGKRSLSEKVQRAGRHYREKYGVEPNVAYVNPKTPGATEDSIAELELKHSREVLPDHLWIGVLAGDDSGAAAPAH